MGYLQQSYYKLYVPFNLRILWPNFTPLVHHLPNLALFLPHPPRVPYYSCHTLWHEIYRASNAVV